VPARRNERGAVEIGTGAYTYGPADCLIANNLIQGDGHVAARQLVAPTGFTWEGNLLWGTNTPGIMPASGFVSADPLLVQRPNDVFRIDAGSAAIDAAVGSLPFVTADMDGDARSGALDVGADEFSMAVPGRHLLSPSEVGPAAP
jgi:poly(beta-D-mannuronate) lyase